MLAASDERARIVELFQANVRQGPCLACIEDNTSVVSADLGQDPRWPEFAAAIVDLNLLYTAPTELSGAQLRSGQALADLAVLGLTQEHDQRRVERLAERPRATVGLSLAADSCRVHIVVHDSGPPDHEPAPAANRPERRF